MVSDIIIIVSSVPIDDTEERSITLHQICLLSTVSSCVHMGVTTEDLVALLTIGVGLFEGLTAGVEAACGGGKAMGWVDTIGISSSWG